MLIVLNTWYYWITFVIHFLNHQCTYKRVQQIEIPKYTAWPSSHCCTIYVKLFRCQNFPILFPVLFQLRVFCGAFCLHKHKSFHIEAHLFWHRDFDGLSRLFCWGTRYGCSHGSTMSIVQSRFNLLLTSIAFFPKNFTSKSFTLILISRPRNSYQTTLHSLWTRKWNVCSKSRYLEFNRIVSADATCLVSHQQNI